jgi:sigma-B regulation protein RsbU (phosphoserine phosphatase)
MSGQRARAAQVPRSDRRSVRKWAAVAIPSETNPEQLCHLLEVTRHLAATTDLRVLLTAIVDATCDVLACERATVFLYDGKTNELYSSVAAGSEPIRIPADRGIAGAAASGRNIINVPDAYADERFNRDVDKQTGYRTRNLLTFPLENLDGDLMGVLQALNKRDGQFDARDEEMACVLSAQAGVALHRQRLLEEFTEKQRMERDLQLARQIQQALFPRENPTVAGYDIAGWNQPADETGGDCYDFVEMPDGRLAILLADATGHGIGAALIMAQFRAIGRALLAEFDDLAQIASRINTTLAHDLTADRFVTAFIGVLDPQKHVLEYVAPGQGPLLFASAGGVERRVASGLPLAVVDDAECDVEAFELAPGDAVVLLTDGFFEAANEAGELFGEDRVVALVQAADDGSVAELIERLQTAAQDFAGDTPQGDDLTAVIVRRSR